MLWTIEFAAGAERDLELLFHYLADSYLNLGSSRAEAAEQALRRVLNIRDTAERIATEPRRGAAHDDLLPGLRHLALDKAIYWFLVDESERRVRVLAVFYGGQDHQRRMLVRLLSQSVR